MEFEWDPRKAAANLAKHKVSFEEAATVFGDPYSTGEQRFVLPGLSQDRRLLAVMYVDRGGAVRIISGRRATRRDYEEINQ